MTPGRSVRARVRSVGAHFVQARFPGARSVRVRARRVAVTEDSGMLGAPDDASAFEVPVDGPDAGSAEQWVRSMFEGAPRAPRWFVVLGWRYVLGLRLGPRRSRAHVLGWRIVTTAPDVIVLEVASALVTAHKVLRVDRAGPGGGRVLVTTFVRYERRPARTVWSAVAPVHHRTEPYLLARAASNPPTGGRSPIDGIEGGDLTDG